MRFVSQSGNLHLGNYRNAEMAMSEAKVVVVDGQRRAVQPEPYVVQPAIPIRFSHDEIVARDIQAAKEHWVKWPGLPKYEDDSPMDPVEAGRIAVWDSVSWQQQHNLTDEDREQAERMLLNHPENGQSYFHLEEVRAPKPWPSYDETHHNKIPVLAAELGLTAAALEYERENKNRASVVEALEGAAPVKGEGVEVVAA